MGFITNLVAKWLGIAPAQQALDITIRESTTQQITTLKNKLWYRGDPAELEQFYQQFGSMSLDGMSRIAQTRFWAAEPTQDVLIRKFHSGLPRLIADKLASIVVDDMNDPELDAGSLQRWEEIAEENTFDELLKDAVVKILSEGDGAFKICVDSDVSQMPLIEFFSGNDVEYTYKRGKLLEILFYTEYFENTKRYRLVETYGRGYVHYSLRDDLNKEVPLTLLPETEMLVDVSFDGDFIMGVPVKFYNSAKFKHRGEAIFEGKGDNFDAMDEIISTWLDAVRAGRVKQYIPEQLVPRNEETGALRKPNVFNQYILKATDLSEDADNMIEVIQGQVEFQGLLTSYVTFLDACLQGLISPSTLGIDVKKLDNAESQREKEKTTMYTRDTIIGVLQKVLPRLVEIALRTQDVMASKSPNTEYEATFEWGQYANPSFEAMVETVGKAKQYGIMSIERCVEELYGDTLTTEEKEAEIALLKEEANATLEVDQPSVNDDLGGDKSGDKKPALGAGEGDGQEL